MPRRRRGLNRRMQTSPDLSLLPVIYPPVRRRVPGPGMVAVDALSALLGATLHY